MKPKTVSESSAAPSPGAPPAATPERCTQCGAERCASTGRLTHWPECATKNCPRCSGEMPCRFKMRDGSEACVECFNRERAAPAATSEATPPERCGCVCHEEEGYFRSACEVRGCCAAWRKGRESARAALALSEERREAAERERDQAVEGELERADERNRALDHVRALEARALAAEERAERAERDLTLARAAADAAGSQMLDVQQECVAVRRALAAAEMAGDALEIDRNEQRARAEAAEARAEEERIRADGAEGTLLQRSEELEAAEARCARAEALAAKWESGWGAAQTDVARAHKEHAAELRAVLSGGEP